METEQEHRDDERRKRLRAFLIERRERLSPAVVGLPSTLSRRRVLGLRRGEVAELVGVSVDWYRAFESGRPVRVSPKFVLRLAQALRLTVGEKFALFCLSLPEIFEPDIVDPAHGIASTALGTFTREATERHQLAISQAP